MDLKIDLLDAAQARLVERVRAHSFLARCRAGTVTLDELKLFLVQHGLYGSYFTRYLCAMMANLPGNGEVQALAQNLFEELGFAPGSPRPHHLLYRDLLEHFGLSLEQARPLTGTRRLIDAMFVHCRAPDPAQGLGALCLGAEALVPAIHADILAGLAACGIEPGPLEFFRLHEARDGGHAQTLRELLARLSAADPVQIQLTLQAGRDVAGARLAFFSSIEAAHRRAALPQWQRAA